MDRHGEGWNPFSGSNSFGPFRVQSVLPVQYSTRKRAQILAVTGTRRLELKDVAT
jgi:hypothetical protein